MVMSYFTILARQIELAVQIADRTNGLCHDVDALADAFVLSICISFLISHRPIIHLILYCKLLLP